MTIVHPALELVVGPGVRDAMAAAGDEPRGHEEYVHDQETGAVLYSLTHGRDALYRWTPRDGVRRLPFAASASSTAGGAGSGVAPGPPGGGAAPEPALALGRALPDG